MRLINIVPINNTFINDPLQCSYESEDMNMIILSINCKTLSDTVCERPPRPVSDFSGLRLSQKVRLNVRQTRVDFFLLAIVFECPRPSADFCGKGEN